jgi:tRNA-binding protein
MTDIKLAPVKPLIKFDEFNKIDIRVGTIEAIEDVQGSDKLLRLKVDFGDHKRIILSGMKKERKDPQDLLGKQTLFIVNLEPKKMMGELSNGMILDVGYQDRIPPALLQPERKVPNGIRAG